MSELLCPCGGKIPIRASAAGSSVRCTRCNRQLVVPPLRVIQEFADRGEPIPPAGSPDETATPQQAIPQTFTAHYYGDVGTNQSISVPAMHNYMHLVNKAVESVLDACLPADRFELMVSCALVPDCQPLVVLETAPQDAAHELITRLEKAIRAIPTPQVERGPVAFFVYRRVNLEAVRELGVQPFRCLQESIEQHGIKMALEMAAGLEPPAQSWLARVRAKWQRFWGTPASAIPDSDSPPASRHEQMNAWLEQLEANTLARSMEQLQWQVIQSSADPSARVALATRYAQQGKLESALSEYTAALKLVPDCAPLLERRARLQMALSNDQAALRDWNRAIELAPDEPWYRYHRGSIYAGLDAWAEAEAELQVALQHAPREPAFALARADLCMTLGRSTEALAELELVAQLDPNCGIAHLQLGRVLQAEGCQDLELAIQHLTKAIELMPDEIEAQVHRSLLYASQNKLELALVDCDQVIQMRPDEGVGYGVRGRVLQLQGEFEEAITACSKAIELGMESSLVWVARGIAYAATGQPELALSDCDTCLARDPSNALALQLRGMLSMEQGEMEAALEALQKAVELAPEWTEPREHLALLHRIQENPQAAIEEQNKLVTQNPGNPAHYVNRAFAYTQSGDYHRAKSDYDRACELDPENEQIFFLRGCFFMARQETQPALRDFDRVLTLAEDHDDARLRRASLLIQLERHSEALADYGKLIARHPDDPQAYLGRAFVHQFIGDEAAAEADVDHLRKLAPENSEEFTIHSLSAKVQKLEREERYEEALETAEEIIALAPEDPMGYHLRAGIYWYTEQYVEARDDYTQLLEMVPEQVALLSSRGQVQAEMGEFQAAVDDLDEVVAKSREEGQTQLLAFALNGRALALAGLSRLEDSQADFEESIRLCPTNAWAFYNRGLVLHRQGEADAARDMLEQALAAKAPPLTKRKRQRTQALIRVLDQDSPRT